VLGGAVAAGVGGGVGAALGIAAAMALAGWMRPPLAWQMALVLAGDGLELHSLSWRGLPKDVLVAVSYADVESVAVEPKRITLRARISLRSGETIVLEASKAGPESGVATLNALRGRAGAAVA
jgi:hypothetical protein